MLIGVNEAAVLVQKTFRGYIERKRIGRISIVHLTKTDIVYERIFDAVHRITHRELFDTVGIYEPVHYFEREHAVPSDAIFLAQAAGQILGFLIMTNTKNSDFDAWIPHKEMTHVAYLAVESECKKLGIGTQLMLTAMRRTKELGKNYLTLEYIKDHMFFREKRMDTRTRFYYSFIRKGIPLKEHHEFFCCSCHAFLSYDLRNVSLRMLMGKEIFMPITSLIKTKVAVVSNSPWVNDVTFLGL